MGVKVQDKNNRDPLYLLHSTLEGWHTDLPEAPGWGQAGHGLRVQHAPPFLVVKFLTVNNRNPLWLAGGQEVYKNIRDLVTSKG